MNKYIKQSSALVLGASLLLGACGGAADKKEDNASEDKGASTDSISFDYDDKEKKWAYDVNLRDRNESHEVTVDAVSNKVLKKESEKENDKETTINYKDVTPVEDIIEVAKKEYNGDVKEWSLDEDDGVVKYDVELAKDGKSKEFEIDAKTKEIIKQDA